MTANAWQREPGSKPVNGGRDSKTRKVLHYMYAPKFASNLGETRRVFGLFSRLIANIFVMQGMFPKNHPALRDEGMRLPMTEVISTAYRSLEWNKASAPKIMFFGAVVASLLFSVMAFLFAFAGFFTHPAHAASLFTSPSPTTDLGNTWLDYIFNGGAFSVNVPNVDAANDPTAGTTTTTWNGAIGIPQMFRQLAAMYSNAMLVLAVVILLYHLISMVVHTAHEGTAMGKSAHQIWAPVRLVFALGLLVPIAGGLSSGQFLILHIAQWGSGLASYVWGDPILGVGPTFINQQQRIVVKPNVEPMGMVRELYAIGYCAKKKQMDLSADRGYYIGNNGAPAYPAAQNATAAEAQDVVNALVTGPAHAGAGEITAKGKQIIIAGNGVDGAPGTISKNYYPVSEVPPLPSGNFEAGWADEPCGSVTFPADNADTTVGANPDLNALIAVHRAHIAAFNQIEIPSLQLGATMAAIDAPRREGANGLNTYNHAAVAGSGAGVQLADSENQLVQLYLTTYANAINTAGVVGLSFNTVNNTVVYEPPAGATATNATLSGNPNLGGVGDLGWMSAGGFFARLATRNNVLQQAANMVPAVTTRANCDEAEGGCPENAFDSHQRQLAFEGEKTTNTDGYQQCAGLASCGSNVLKAMMEFIGLANAKGQWLWHTQFTSPYPLSDMVNLGSTLVDGAIHLIVLAVTFNAIKAVIGTAINSTLQALPGVGKLMSKVSGSAAGAVGRVLNKLPLPVARVLQTIIGTGASFIGAIMDAIPSIMYGLASLMALPGIILFYVLPLLPFFNFVTGIITWMVSLLQAVVAIPVIAIAHLTPHGEGLPSGAARGAYNIVLQIFLRPIMMIFGLIVCVLVMNTGIGILNALFFGIYKYNLVGGGQSGMLSSLVFFVLYAMAAFGIVNAAVTAIDDFPLNSVKWIGGSNVDTNHDVSRMGAMAAAFAANNAISGGIGGLKNFSPPTSSYIPPGGAPPAGGSPAGGLSPAGGPQLPGPAGPASPAGLPGAGNMRQLPGSTGTGGTGGALPGPTPPRLPGPSGGSGSGGVQPTQPAGSVRRMSPSESAAAQRDPNVIDVTPTSASTGRGGGLSTTPFGRGGINPAAAGTIRSAGATAGPAVIRTGRAGYQDAVAAARAAGHPQPELAAAQWALESGYGRHQSGQNNYFGIKDFSGRGSSVMTHEVINGRSVAMAQNFRNFATPAEGFAHHAGMMNRMGRYAGVRDAATPAEAAAALQRGGYATDPQYAAKLTQIMRDNGVNVGAAGTGGSTALAQAGGVAQPSGAAVAAGEQPMAQPQPVDPLTGEMETAWAAAFGVTGGADSALEAPAGIDPRAQEPPPQQSSGKGMLSTGAHLVLGGLSFIPGVSIVAGGLDAIIYTAEGDYVGAGLAAVGMIPGGKWVTTGGKLAFAGVKGARELGLGARMLRGAGAMAREAKMMNALGGNGSGTGQAVASNSEPFDPYKDSLEMLAAEYIASAGKKRRAET